MSSGRKKLKRKKTLKRAFGLAVIAVGLVIVLLLFDDRLRPLLKTVAESKATTLCTMIINEDVAELLAESGVDYTRLVTIERDPNGLVTSVQTDMAMLNSFKANLTSRIQQDVSECEYGTVSLPIGTIIGGDYFVGRGPMLKFHLDMSCNVMCSISNNFDDAGINQTRHQIMLNIEVVTYIIIPWYRTSANVNTNYVIAETVIVGAVPDYFTSVDGSENVVDDINDYAYDVN